MKKCRGRAKKDFIIPAKFHNFMTDFNESSYICRACALFSSYEVSRYLCYEPKYGPYSMAVLMYISLNTLKYPNFVTYFNEN